MQDGNEQSGQIPSIKDIMNHIFTPHSPHPWPHAGRGQLQVYYMAPEIFGGTGSLVSTNAS